MGSIDPDVQTIADGIAYPIASPISARDTMYELLRGLGTRADVIPEPPDVPFLPVLPEDPTAQEVFTLIRQMREGMIAFGIGKLE